MCAVRGHQNIKTRHVQDSWKATGHWPMNYEFSETLRRQPDILKEPGDFGQQKLSHTGPCYGVNTLRRRTSDHNTFERLAEIVDTSRSRIFYAPSRVVLERQNAPKDQHTASDILMESTRPPTSHKNISVAAKKNVVLPCGDPAQYLAHTDVMELREVNCQINRRKTSQRNCGRLKGSKKDRKGTEETGKMYLEFH